MDACNRGVNSISGQQNLLCPQGVWKYLPLDFDLKLCEIKEISIKAQGQPKVWHIIGRSYPF